MDTLTFVTERKYGLHFTETDEFKKAKLVQNISLRWSKDAPKECTEYIQADFFFSLPEICPVKWSPFSKEEIKKGSHARITLMWRGDNFGMSKLLRVELFRFLNNTYGPLRDDGRLGPKILVKKTGQILTQEEKWAWSFDDVIEIEPPDKGTPVIRLYAELHAELDVSLGYDLTFLTGDTLIILEDQILAHECMDRKIFM